MTIFIWKSKIFYNVGIFSNVPTGELSLEFVYMYFRVLIFKRGQPGILLCTTFVCTIHYEDIHVHTLAIIYSKCNHLDQYLLFTVRTWDILSNIGGGLWSFGTKQLAVTSAMVALVKTKSLLFNFTKLVTKTGTKKRTN